MLFAANRGGIIIKKAAESEYYIFPALILFVTLLPQGGFYPNGILISGALSAAVLMFSKPRIGKEIFVFVGFCIWYLFCTVIHAFTIESLSLGFLPVSALLFRLVVSDERLDREKTVGLLLELAVIPACVGIIICTVKTIESGRFIRLVFPLGYSNASGLIFGICFILSDKYLKKAKFIFAAALVMSFSLGAAALTLAAYFILSDKKKRIILICVILAAAVVFHAKLQSSACTFLERLLQIHDGFRCLLENPFSGIGAGNWKNFVHMYKTGFYTANTIHCSYMQIAVDSGLPGAALFIAMIIMPLKGQSKLSQICLAMILLHSLIEFNVSYTVMWQIFILLAEKKLETDVRKGISAAASAAMLVIFTVLSVLIMNVQAFAGQRDDRIIRQHFETNKLYQHSETAEHAYLCSEMKSGQKEKMLEYINGKAFLTEEMIYLKHALCPEKEDELIKKYPYNSYLLHHAEKNYLEGIEENMSVFGKLLYKKMGENN